MNSRTRLLTTLHGGVADRVPVSTYELVGYNSRAFENNDPSYAQLMEAVREKTDCVCMWDPATNAQFLESAFPVEMETEESHNGDATIRRNTVHTPKGDLTQTTKTAQGVHTVWQTEHWCKTLADVDKALSVPFEPLDYDFADFDRIQNEVGENGIIMTSLADPLWLAADLMEFGQYTVWARTETEHFARTVAAMHERVMENLERMLTVRVVDLYRICGPEYATPPYVPPDLFGRLVVPYVSEMVDRIHANGALARLHCHGRIGQVLDMIRDTGADAIDPCEAPPDGDITLAEVKRRISDRLCIFGNIQLRLLECARGEQVERAVEQCMTAAKASGGYVIMPTAAPITSPLPTRTEENYLCFIETALRCGAY